MELNMKKHITIVRWGVPSTKPRNPLQFEFLKITLNLVPLRTLELALISLTASSMATFATLPIVESRVKIAPTFTTLGLEEAFALNPFDSPPNESVENRTIQNTFILHTHRGCEVPIRQAQKCINLTNSQQNYSHKLWSKLLKIMLISTKNKDWTSSEIHARTH